MYEKQSTKFDHHMLTIRAKCEKSKDQLDQLKDHERKVKFRKLINCVLSTRAVPLRIISPQTAAHGHPQITNYFIFVKI